MEGERNDTRPTWWLLDAIDLLLIGLIWLVEAAVPRGGARSILEVVVVIPMVGLIVIWVRSNRVAIELEIWALNPRFVDAVASAIGRHTRMAMVRNEEEIYVTVENQNFTTKIERY